jgi:hypothetical protein
VQQAFDFIGLHLLKFKSRTEHCLVTVHFLREVCHLGRICLQQE